MTEALQQFGEINALLGKGTEFSGKLTFEGKVRIDGKFSGEIFTDDVLIVGEGAVVMAEIEVSTLIIKGGFVNGNVRAKEAVEIHAPGKLVGNIVSPQLYIEHGVIFEGHCKMSEAAEASEAEAEEAAEGASASKLQVVRPAK